MDKQETVVVWKNEEMRICNIKVKTPDAYKESAFLVDADGKIREEIIFATGDLNMIATPKKRMQAMCQSVKKERSKNNVQIFQRSL